MTYPIADLDGIDEDALKTLKSIGIRTTARLLDAAKGPRDRKRLAERTGFDEKQILAWANAADRMRIKGVGEEYAELLREAGVDTVRELMYRNPSNLSKAMADANRKRKLVRLLPSENVVGRWIKHARTLPPKIRY